MELCVRARARVRVGGVGWQGGGGGAPGLLSLRMTQKLDQGGYERVWLLFRLVECYLGLASFTFQYCPTT